MPSPFVEVPVTVSPLANRELARERLKELIEEAGIVGYEAKETTLEVIILQVAAELFSGTTQTAAVVLNAIFRAFGTELLKLPFNEGAAATGKTRWTIVPAEGVRQIEAGTQLEAGGHGFKVEETTEVKAKAMSVELQVAAIERGTESNGVSGVAQQVNPYDWVTEVQFVGETADGTEEELDTEYLIRLAAWLELQAPRPVNAADFAPFLLGVPTSILPSGTVGRATSLDLYDAETGEENTPNCCTTWVTGPGGEELTKADYEALETWVSSFTSQNFRPFVKPPHYETIYATFKIHVLTGYAPESVIANVQKALEELLSPKWWGIPTSGIVAGVYPVLKYVGWVNEKTVRYNTILTVIGSVPGVAYIFDGSEGLKIGTSPSPTGTADITLSGGPVVLAQTVSGGIKGSAA